MTVRVTKPEFNIREKLAQLERPVGLKGSELMKSETTQDAREVISAGRKNLIINGACTISQRRGAATYTLDANDGGGEYAVDRFRSWAIGGGAFTIQRSDNAPPGFKNSLMYTVSTVDTSVGSSEYYCIQQRIEGYNIAHLKWGTDDAKPVTLSFWVKSDVTGTYTGSFWNGGQSYTCAFEYKIFESDVWEYKTVTIPGPRVGSYPTDNAVGIGIWWDLGSGAGFNAPVGVWQNTGDFRTTNQVQFIEHNGAKFRMTGIQLEVGLTATEFEHRPYGEEMALCQRYYQNSYDQAGGKYPGNTDDNNGPIHTTWNDGNSPFGMFPTVMRVAPTVTLRPRGSSTTGQVKNNGVDRTASAQMISNQGIGYLLVSSGSVNTWCAYSYELNAEF